MCRLNQGPFLLCCLPSCPPACQTAAWLSRGPGEEAVLGLNLRGAGAREVIWANKMAWCSSQRMPTTGPHELHFNSARTQPQTSGSRPTCTGVCEWYSESQSQTKTLFPPIDGIVQTLNTFKWTHNLKQGFSKFFCYGPPKKAWASGWEPTFTIQQTMLQNI